MNDTEERAYIWLLKQGYNDITFRRRDTPDFILKNGEKFEVKKVRNNAIWFSPSQLDQLDKEPNTKIIVMNDAENPVAVFPFSEIENDYWNNIKIVGRNYNKIINIRLDESVWRKAKIDAIDNQMTLQDWITLLILQGKTDKVEATK